MVAREIGNGEGVVRGAINEICGKRAAHRIQPAVGEFGLKNPRGAGADEHANAPRAIFLSSDSHHLGEAILHQTRKRQSIVTAIEIGQLFREAYRVQSCNFACECCQVNGVKCAWRKTGLPRA